MTIASNAEEITDIVTVVCTNIGISFSKLKISSNMCNFWKAITKIALLFFHKN